MFKFSFLLIAISLLTACAAAGPAYNPTSLEQKKKGMAQVTVYWPRNVIHSMRTPSVEVNGFEVCDMKNAGYFTKYVEPGRTIVSTTLWDRPGTSTAKFTAKANQQYFIEMNMDAGKLSSGSLGVFLTDAISEDKGPFVMRLIEKDDALPKLKRLNLVSECASN